jgi:betaine reductase
VIRVAHYVNQFFGGIGGEEFADHPFEVRDGPVGPGTALEMNFAGAAEIALTLVCGDNYFQYQTDEVIEEILATLAGQNIDVLVAGPGFNAGRYGIACASVCAAVTESMALPAITGLFPGNPAVEMFHDRVIIVSTLGSVAGMRAATATMARLALKLTSGQELGPAEGEGILGRGFRANWIASSPAATRAVDMLLAKVAKQEYVTEIPLAEARELVAPADAIPDLSAATVAIVTEGGLIPLNNPDHIESSRATKWATYPVALLEKTGSVAVASIHAGFDTRWVNEDPNRIVPVDAMRSLEADGIIGKLHDRFFVTVGTGMAVTTAERIGTELARALIADGVQAVILTST